MTRPIKFRTWYPIEKVMKHKIALSYNGKIVTGFNPFASGVDHFTYEEKAILTQFTGLTDKNGKEIYEGDIVKNNDSIWDIYYDEGAWKMGLNGKRTNNDHLFLLEPKHSEVIGNIYENPELLTN